jgi:hypothetical protein
MVSACRRITIRALYRNIDGSPVLISRATGRSTYSRLQDRVPLRFTMERAGWTMHDKGLASFFLVSASVNQLNSIDQAPQAKEGCFGLR